jgi:hypothetical protein
LCTCLLELHRPLPWQLHRRLLLQVWNKVPLENSLYSCWFYVKLWEWLCNILWNLKKGFLCEFHLECFCKYLVLYLTVWRWNTFILQIRKLCFCWIIGIKSSN